MSELDDFVAWSYGNMPAEWHDALLNARDRFSDTQSARRPARRPEFARRGLAGYVEQLRDSGSPVCIGLDVARGPVEWSQPQDATSWKKPADSGSFPLHGAADTALTEKPFAPELDALACDCCSRALLPGEADICADCMRLNANL